MHCMLNINKLLLCLKKPCRIRQPCVQSTFCVSCSRAINTLTIHFSVPTTVKSACLKLSSDRSAHLFFNLSHQQGLSACKHSAHRMVWFLNPVVILSRLSMWKCQEIKRLGNTQSFPPHFDVNINWCPWSVYKVYKLCHHLIEWLHKWADVQVSLVHPHFFIWWGGLLSPVYNVCVLQMYTANER